MEEENTTTPNEVREKNIANMAFGFSTMSRIFEKGMKEKIVERYCKTVSKFENVTSQESFDKIHKTFCEWFMDNIFLAKKSEKKPSYGQAAKVLDTMLKVDFYYCRRNETVLEYLHIIIDTVILKNLKSIDDLREKLQKITNGCMPRSIYGIDKKIYTFLQEYVREHENITEGLLLVQWDDITWSESKFAGKR